ncbi:MAG: 23S rRNA (pseudouridine(1915)-N(3))-methyltransferase RlmH [Gammaproteobacteria bacterium]|nr:23S rRNA (pseudouridine(1915)-N(3))-methyltransferase RlmH [Gammaproteobacteria bacterium]MBA3730969.1 23S rRNA (pseudouridine(1915)-N(3))-methyltransferase RlmH [Gammaproteobacteria bacterium]
MRVRLLAVGTRMPDWINAGVHDYARRLPRQWAFAVTEVPVSRRRPPEPDRCRTDEGERLMAALYGDTHVVALDERGSHWRTAELASRIEAWMQSGQDLTFMIGGPDGLAPACIERANERWSLSALTFPHALARVIVAEQLYRASTILRNHPYHRS